MDVITAKILTNSESIKSVTQVELEDGYYLPFLIVNCDKQSVKSFLPEGQHSVEVYAINDYRADP